MSDRRTDPDSFTPTKRSQLRRAHERASYDRKSLHAVLDAGIICHVGYVIDAQPYVSPTMYWRDGDLLYWHGSSASRMIQATTTGAPVCVTASHFDGLVLARSGFHSSVNYRSATLFGTARAVEDRTQKMAQLEALIERLTPGRWAEQRAPTEPEFKGTMVAVMEIEEASVKTRSGPPSDDEEDYASPMWAGVLPLATTVGEPVPDPRLKPDTPLPGYVKAFRIG